MRPAARARARSLLTVVAVVQPDSVAVVLAVAFHGVVAEVALGHLVVGIDDDLQGCQRLFRDAGVTDEEKCWDFPACLENVVPRFDVGDVDPLAVDVVAIQIPAAHRDALVTKVCTFVPLRNAWWTRAAR